MALNEETEAVFKSSRSKVDPVSGNDVPPGSLPEEVRDDIPAQLSEGEYVVPADVLRFYGMKFFEDLRQQAKMELARMDRDGRIGGEPIAVMEISELSPEEIEELDAIGAAVGGYMTQQPMQTNVSDPYQQQQMMYNQDASMGAGYYNGGDVDSEPDVTQPTYTTPDLLSEFGAGFSFTQPSQAEYTTVTLYGPSGDIITLTLPTQQELYEQKIAEGYTTEQVAVTTETTVGKEDEGEPTKTQVTPEPLDISKIKSEDLAKTAKGLGTISSIATAIASTAGLPVAALVNTSMIADYNDIVDRMNEEGINDEGLEKKGSIFGGKSGLFEDLKDFDESGGASFGDTWLGDLLGFDGKAGVQGDNLSDSFGGSRRTGGDDDGGTSTPAPSSKDDNNKTPSGTTYAQGESPLEKEIQTQADYVTSASAGNKGGLMTNKKKKKK